MLVTEPCPNLAEIVSEAIRGGVNVVQYRDKRILSRDDRFALSAVQRACPRSVPIVVNANDHVLHAFGPDGIHLAEDGMSIRDAQRLNRNRKILVGRSVHSLAKAVEAENEGADYIVAGTVFASSTHPNAAPQGIEFLEQVCESIRIPVVAIGGIMPENVNDCIAAGAAGVAVLSPIMRSDNPREVARAYRDALDSAI